ncbi:MAG: hypothetical protein ACREXT_11570 [Gammaproteobacteria bacterium]
MRTLHPTLIAEKNKLATGSAWLPLIQVEVSSTLTLYLVPNPSSVTFDSQVYDPFPVTVDMVEQDTRGGLGDVLLAVSNVGRTVGAYVEANDLRGKRVQILYVNSSKLDDPTAYAVKEIYEINAINVDEKVVKFVLGHERVLSQKVPAGRHQRDNCRWIYKSVECGYSGTMANCDKILNGVNGCRAHLNVPRFGGFPLMPKTSGRA